MPSGANNDIAAPGRLGNGRTITAGAGTGGAMPTDIRRAIAEGRSTSVQVALKSVRDALGLGATVTVDKATEADLTRTDELGRSFTTAFNLKAPQFDGSRFQD